MNCRIAEDFFCTVSPSCCTSAGSCDSAVCTRLLTLTVSMSGLVPEREADGQRVAAVIAAVRLHVDHLVDADDLRLDRLRDGALHHLRRGTGVGGGDRHLRRHDVGKLRHRNAQHRQHAGDRDDDRDDDRQPRPADEDGGDHRRLPAGRVAQRRAGWPGHHRPDPAARAGCRPAPPSAPSVRPLSTATVTGVAWPSCTRVCCTLLSAPTT